MKNPMPLGELVAALKRKDQAANVRFDFVHFKPCGIHSYRGDYSEIALGYDRDVNPTVADVLRLCEDAIGRKFVGYKGGSYEMHEGTPVYVANHDEAGGTAVIDVRDDGWVITLETATVDP